VSSRERLIHAFIEKFAAPVLHSVTPQTHAGHKFLEVETQMLKLGAKLGQ
jgi:hypothetical protein